jgi:hypothetical protein
MGTNYYLETECCQLCKRPKERLHIGKSSAGWCFALHVDREEGIESLEDWKAAWSRPGSRIVDEYGVEHTPSEITTTITEREWRGEFPRRNNIDQHHCVSHGKSSYDLIIGDFS